jgi:hypothetical protein
MPLRHGLALALGIALASCSDPVGVESDILAAEIAGDNLELRNAGEAPVFYFALDRETLAVVDWVICTDPNDCQSVPARSAKLIPVEQVHPSDGDADILVYHWRLVSGDSPTGYVADSLRTLTVPLR